MLDYMVGVEDVHGIIGKWELAPEVRPDIDLGREKVGIYILPAWEVFILAWTQLNLYYSVPGRQKIPV
jgi:hypothetical protein